jgi:23S rRNA (uracil1939-C5)-methyltransferase
MYCRLGARRSGARRTKPNMEVKIEKLIYGGEGLAHQDGATVFVPFVLPGEQVTVAPAERKKKFVRATLGNVLEASPERVAAPCPHFAVCGGCDYQHIPYDAQLKYKAEILRETLRRLGRVDWTGEITAHGSPPWGYRNRAQWKVRPLTERGEGLGGSAAAEDASERPSEMLVENSPREEGAAPESSLPRLRPGTDDPGRDKGTAAQARGGAAGGTKLATGYFRANSTALCAVETCEIISPLLLKTLRALREAGLAGEFPRSLREFEAFADASDSKLLLTATFAGFPTRAAEVAEKMRQIVPEIESLLFFDPTRDRMELFGPGFIEYEACGTKFRVGHFSFFQVNRFLVDELARVAVESEGRGRLALDLFAGAGLFSVGLAKRFDRVVAVESNPAAARDLEGNVRGGGVEVRAADVETFLRKYKEKPDLALLDPPRAGLGPEGLKSLTRVGPKRITYVSCEPPTLARDLAGLIEGGYEISEVHLLDLFPQTFHMEAVVRLKRRA